MPRRKSSVRKTRTDKKRHLRNLKVKQDLKKTLKKFQSLLSGKGLEEARAFLKDVYSTLDKAAKKKIIPVAFANRKKSRLAAKLRKTA